MAPAKIRGPVAGGETEIGGAETAPADTVTGVRPRRFDDAATPSRIQRFVVIERLGSGGMGDVFAAYDPKLDRKVALKLIRRTSGGSELDSVAQGRMLREAKALAQVSHPNVVAVYDADLDGDELYIAMEHVAGSTLRQWLQTQRTTKQILDVFLAAARGLLAAHQAGLVHRDFKPDNVLVGDDGRVRVVDFGLAIPADDATQAEDGVRSSPSLDRVTERGAVVGTPRYMAPEQYELGDTDARTDQFAFCVALYEALYGEHPFEASSLAQLAAEVTGGAAREPKRHGAAPGRALRALMRGLRRDPADRFEDMQHLVDALRPRARGGWRGWVLGGTAVWAAAMTVWVLGGQHADLCASASGRLASIWDDEVRVVLADRFDASGAWEAASTWSRVEHSLSDYSDRWVDARTEACLATSRGEQSGDTLDLRMGCLDRHRAALAALVGELREADANVVGKAVSASAQLPEVEACADVERLRTTRTIPDDPQTAARVADLDKRLAEVKAKHDAGRIQAAADRAQTLLDEAIALDHEPTIGWVRYRLAYAQEDLGQIDAALENAEATAVIGIAHGVDALVARAASLLVWIYAERSAEYALAQTWAKLGMAALQRTGGDPRIARSLLSNRGVLHMHMGLFAEAERDLTAAADAAARAWGPQTAPTVAPTFNLGNLFRLTGELSKAEAAYRTAVQTARAQFGPGHPTTLAATVSVVHVLQAANMPAAALAEGRSLLAEQEKAPTRNAPNLAITLHTIGVALSDLGRTEEALDYFERALANEEGFSGPKSRGIIMHLVNIAQMHIRLKQAERAAPLVARALELARAPGADKTDTLTNVLYMAAKLAALQEDYDAAEARTIEALAAADELPPTHKSRYELLEYRGALDFTRKRYSSAQEWFDAAIVGMSKLDPVPMFGLARAHTAAAQTQLALGDPDQARAFAETALILHLALPTAARSGLPDTLELVRRVREH